ncbi:MAG: dimethylsulfoniopropionate demethylase [Gammaproteobacteria bacterium]|nr:dimethylsulfoniopropionate demethylase [Gammaproteobacteria bacterium]
MSAPKLNVSRRIRATPYTPCVEALGVSGYTVVNHTVLPKGFEKTVEEDYWHLKEHVQLWDVGCQRQVELRGRDAAKLAQLMTPRSLSNAAVGQCLYAPLVDDKGAMLNDPIILKLSDDHFWLSIADSDVLLWAKGLAVGMGLDVSIIEPDVWPLAVQGPKADDLMAKVFGKTVRGIRFFRFAWLDFCGHQLLVARSGYSKQGGFEIYLDKPDLGVQLWSALWEAGIEFNVSLGSPNLIERVEGGLLSYGNEMTVENNPLECGLDQYCTLDGSVDFIGYKALRAIAKIGPERRIRGIIFDGPSCPPCQYPWPIRKEGAQSTEAIGKVTTAIWSPRFENNVALAMIEKGNWSAGTKVLVESGDGFVRNGVVTELPMLNNSLEVLQR